MDAYVTQPTVNYYSIVVGHETLDLVHPSLFVPRKFALDHENNYVWAEGKKYKKSYEMDVDALSEKTVSFWNTPLRNAPESKLHDKFVQEMKSFLKQDNWTVLLVYHEKVCDWKGNKSVKMPSNGSHFHVIWKTAQSIPSKGKQYKRLKRSVDECGGYMAMKRIVKPHLNLENYMVYLHNDNEKFFLGTNDEQMLNLWNIVCAREKDWLADTESVLLEDCDEGEAEASSWRSLKPPSFSRKTDLKQIDDQGFGGSSSTDTRNDTYIDPFDGSHPVAPVPKHMRQTKSAESYDFFQKIVRENPDVQCLNLMVTKYPPASAEFVAICHSVGNTQCEKLFRAAREQYVATLAEKPAMSFIEQLPDEIPNHMSPEDSFKMFNSWCREQCIPERWLYTLMHALLSGKGNKKCGIYFQGEANSGKTMMSNSPFDCMTSVAGKITKDNFPWQVLGDKKIAIGEEIQLNQTNVEKYKDLLSGARSTCERKGTTPAYCKLNLCLMNSNYKYGDQLTSEQKKTMMTRLYLIEGLRRSDVIKECYGLIHPKLWSLGRPCNDEEIDLALANEREVFRGELNNFPSDTSADGRHSYFRENWETDEESLEELPPVIMTSTQQMEGKTYPLIEDLMSRPVKKGTGPKGARRVEFVDTVSYNNYDEIPYEDSHYQELDEIEEKYSDLQFAYINTSNY